MWAISDSGACYSGDSGEAIGQTGILDVGKEYLVSIEVSGRTKGKVRFDSFGYSETFIENGVYQLSGIALIPDLSLTALDYGSGSFDGCLKFVYIVRVPLIEVYNSCSEQLVYTVPTNSMTVYKANIQVIIPWDLPDSTYYVQVTDENLDYKSECFAVGNHSCTLLLTWTNTDNGYGIDYENLAQVNKLRVLAKNWKPKPDTEKTIFEFSNGEEKIIYASTKMNRDLTIKALPGYLVEALGIGTAHDKFTIEGTEYIVPENIETSWRNSSETTPVNMVVRKKRESLINRNCK